MHHHPPPASRLPLSATTTDQIQKYLEDNKNLIMAILEYQKLGRFEECAQYQAVLQKNLMYLAAIADAQSPTPQTTPNPSQASSSFLPPPSSIPQASNFMQQPGSGGGLKLPYQMSSIQNQDQQQQLWHFQQQQQFQAQVGLRASVQNNMFGMQSALGADPGGKRGGSEAAYGGDGRGMFFDNGSFRDA